MKCQGIFSFKSAAVVIDTLNLCMMDKFACFLLLAAFSFQNKLFQNIISGTPAECQTVWIQIRPDILSGLIWGQTVCNADNTWSQRVKG